MTAAGPIRILIVDDSVVIRKLLTQTLAEAPGLEVVATAGLGRIALTKIPQVQPDIVILDVEMPEMDGIETLKRIRKEAPRLPVIMFSTKTERGAAATIEALTCGASDYVAKPSNVGNVLLAMSRVREELVPKIHALTQSRRGLRDRPVTAPPAPSPAPASSSSSLGAPPPASPFAGRPASPFGTTSTLPSMAASFTTTTVLPPLPPSLAAAIAPPAPPTPGSGSGPIGRAVNPTARPIAPTSPPLAAAQAHASANAAAQAVGLSVPRPAPAAPAAAARPRPPSVPIIAPGQFKIPRQVGPRPPIEIVAIGASTGGPNALAVLLAQLPPELPVPVVIVQHMLATFTRHFAERLAAQCAISIVEANPGEPLLPGKAYIARGDYHLTVERRGGKPFAQLNQDPLENFCRPAVDVLFRSVASTYGASALGVVLTGMGHDGLLGCGAIREAGGDVIVQDEATSVVWGMPGFVSRAGLASQVLPLDHLGPEIRRRIQLGSLRLAGAAAP